MTVEARKLHFIEEFLKITDENSTAETAPEAPTEW